MLEGVVTGVLNRFLSAYVDNLNGNQLKLGIWSGDVKLKNLKLKKEALDKFRLPIDVVEGYLGNLTLSIPWSNLSGKPVRVLIEDVYLLAVPTDSSKATPEEDEARAQAAKQEKLENAEMMTTQPTSGLSLEEEKKNESFTASLVTKIVDNLQIEVRNIHIRYEDKLSVPGHPFSAGITLSGFSAVSTDSDWHPTFINSSQAGIHKLAKLESLAIYFDTDSESLAGYSSEESLRKFTALVATETRHPQHQFVLKPVSGEGRLVLNKKLDGKIAKTDAELLFKELGFVIDADQYRDVLSMVDLFHFYIRQREYRRFRPAQKAIESNRHKALWKFAIEAIRTEVHEKNRKWSWAYFEERRDDRKAYVRLFKAKETNHLAIGEDTANLAALEKKLGYKDIRFYRSIARSEMRKERLVAKEEAKAHPAPAAKQQGWVSWATGWGAPKTPGDVDADEESSTGLNEQQRKELYKAIDWDESDTASHQPSIDIARDTLMLRVKAKLERGSFALKSDPHGRNTDLVSLQFDDFQLDLLQRPDNFEAQLALGGLGVFDGTCEGSVHPQIVRVKADKIQERQNSLPSRPPEDIEADELEHFEVAESAAAAKVDPFFWLKFEHAPLDGRADNALAVKLRHMEIIYHRGYVEAIFKFFKPPESQLESVGALIDVASVTLEGIRKETRAGLEYALHQHKTVDVQLDLNAPIIIIPETMTKSDGQHVVLDAGHISVTSDLADKEALNEIKLREKTEYKEEDYHRLESLMYDKFTVKLQSAQLLMGPSLQSCLDALDDDENGHGGAGGELHILERTSIAFLAQNCILAQAPNLTRFKVSGSLPLIQVNLSDRKYKSMMRMIDVAIPHVDDDEAPSRPAAAPVRTMSTFAQNRQAEEHEIEHGLDDDAEEASGDEDDEKADQSGKDEFFDTPDITDGKTGVHQKTFEFVFNVERVQASIFRSHSDPTKPDRLLVNTVLEGFQFEFGLRPFDMSVDILLRSLYIEDKMIDDETEFRHLVTSKKLNAKEGAQSQDLVRIHYQGVQKTSPEFMTVHEGFDKTVDVEFSTLNVIITRGSVLTLFDWVMTTFTDQEAPATAPLPNAPPDAESSELEVGGDKLRVKVKLTSIAAILNEDGFRLATLSLSSADVTVILRSPTIRVATRLGSLSFTDDFSSDEPKEMLSIQGDELADFQYETYDPSERATYPGYDTLVHLRSGSLQFTFSEEPVHRILLFLTKFKKMKDVYDAAAAAAAQRATEMQTQISKMHYDILVRTPIVIFPHDELNSKDVIVANLGEISLRNSFDVSDDFTVTKIQAGLSSVRLTSSLFYEGEAHELQILDDVTIGVSLTQTESVDSKKELEVPATQIVADMTDVKMNVTEGQYRLIFGLLRTIPSAFDFSDEDVDDEVTPPPSRDALELKSASVPAAGKIGESETVDLLPELSPVAKGADGTTHKLRTSLEASFKVGTIYLQLFTAAGVSKATIKDAALARFALNDTGVKYKMMANGSMEAEVVIRSFTVHDTRPARQTKFREIIPATSHGGHQFMINFTQSGGVDKSSFANVTIDTPKIIFSLDPLFALLDYFMSAFRQTKVAADAEEEEVEPEAAVTTAPAPGDATFAFRVNVVSPTIILLDDPERADSEAVILSISQVQMAQQGTLALTVSKIGMFLCRMDRPKETIRFLDNFDINLSMDSRADQGHQLTSIDIGVQPLVLRVSFRDIFLIKSIVNRAVEMSNRTTSEVEERAPVAVTAATVRSVSKVESTRRTRSASRSRRRSSAGALQPQLIMSRETLQATVDGFQLVLIGDTHDLPMLDVKAGKFSAKINDWSSDMKGAVTIAPFINYFNLRVSHWEPLMDPWEFSIHVSRSVATGLLNISISSQKRLEMNLTSTFIELALTSAAMLGREGDKVFTKPRGANAPFLIKNRTGYPLSLWSEASGDKGVGAERLEDGKDVPWRFDDWRTMRENISATSHNSLTVLFEGTTWERLRHVFVDREGEHIYALRPKLNKVTHRLLCEVKLVENVKIITFRSTFQVENRSLVTAEMVIVDANGKRASQIYKIPPGGDCAVPIIAAYESRIKLRPDPGFGYLWSAESFHWQDLVKRPTRAIVCKSAKEAAFRFQAYAIHDKSDPLIRVYPKISLRIRAPVEIQNLLPHDIRYRVFDKNLEHNWTSYLRQDGISPIHVAELSHLLLLSVEVQDTVFQRSEFSIINTDNPEDLPVEHDLVLADKEGLKLNLRVHYQKLPDSGGAFRVQVYTPYLFINKTGSDFALKTKTFLSSAKNVAGQQVFSADHKRKGEEPFMFSFPTEDTRNRVLLRIGESNWSKPLSFETVGMETEIVIQTPDGNKEVHVGLKVTEGLGDYKLTKVVTIYPRFIVKNSMARDIRFREHGSKDEVLVPQGERHSIGFLRVGVEPQLVVSFTGGKWSAPFRIQDLGRNHVRVKEASGEEMLLRTEVMIEGPTMFIRLEQEESAWPYLLRNDSDYPITFCQVDVTDESSGAADEVGPKYTVAGQEKLPYAWDQPASSSKRLKIEIGGRERLISVMEIGSQVPFRFRYEQHTRVVSIDVRAEGATQAIRFSNYTEEHSVFKLQRQDTNLSRPESLASSREAVFEAVDVDVVTTFSFGVSLEGIGISIVNKRMQELVYASFRGVTAKYSDSTTNVAYDLGVKWIQVDNQLFGGLYPILLYPSVIPKDGKELEVHPSLQASVVILKDDSHGVTYFKYASVLLQEMTVEVDEDFLFALLDFAKFSGATGQEEPPSKLIEEEPGIPEPKGAAGAGDVYFEVLHLQPIQLDLSFMRTDRVNVDQKLNTRNPLFFFINALTMALGNVNDAPVRLNALVIENVRLSMPDLQGRLTLHYSNEFFGQLYRVLGSADFLGNPVGLFTNVSSGVADFFIQPYDSVMMNGNKDLGIGIARGAGSLAKKTVFGLSDSLAKVSGSIGKGLSAATLDQQYQSQRRMRQFRNKPKHALYGVTAGAASFVTSVASGFEGVVTKPLEGAEAGGAAGFFKGVGKGLIGAVTKPAVGIFDLANNITEGIRNTTTVFDQSSIDRVRLPRFTASDGILRAYQEREALGQNWLKNIENGKYFSETYVAHLDIPTGATDDALVVVLTTVRILLVKIQKLKVGWDVPLSDLQTISLEPTGITLVLRGGVAGPFLAIPDQSARLWLFRSMERIVTAHNSRRIAE